MAALNQKVSLVTKASAVPAAGANIALTLDEPILLQTFSVQLTTSAVAANRNFNLTIEDAAGRVFFRVPAGGVHAASLVRQYAGQGANFAPPALLDATFIIPLGANQQGIYVPQGGVIRTVTTLIDATDQYTALTVSGERIQ